MRNQVAFEDNHDLPSSALEWGWSRGLLRFVLVLLVGVICLDVCGAVDSSNNVDAMTGWVEDGEWHYEEGLRLKTDAVENDASKSNGSMNVFINKKKREEASHHFWQSILDFNNGKKKKKSYSIQDAFAKFMSCFDRPIEGFLVVARESAMRGQCDMSKSYCDQILSYPGAMADEKEECQILNQHCDAFAGSQQAKLWQEVESWKVKRDASPEVWHNRGTALFNNKQHAEAVLAFDKACTLGFNVKNRQFSISCVNAIYCRAHLANWTNYQQDMELLQEIAKLDIATFPSTSFAATHPHMVLGFMDLPFEYITVAGRAASNQEFLSLKQEYPQLKPYTSHYYHPDPNNSKLKVGFVGAGFNSKAVLLLAQDIFRFYDVDKIQMHVFSVGKPDSEAFIQVVMRGVDWRQRVKHHVDFFHDVQHMTVPQLAAYIHDVHQIQVLIDWDGYARQGFRAAGLFTLKPAPIQILHQEFIGTTGNPLVDYVITDHIVTPPHLQSQFVEHLIYMPHHFFCKGHAMHPQDIAPPTIDYKPSPKNKDSNDYEYVQGTGTPQYNACTTGRNNVDFVFCNFNKFLKFNPPTMDAWISILEQVPNSMLCLLENPKEAVPNLKSYIRQKSPVLVDQVVFLPWKQNPFDFQKYNRDLCNVLLDAHPYNSHTTAQDAMFGGVPSVTRSDGQEMSSRVTSSANIVLNLDQWLNAQSFPKYVEMAVTLATDNVLYEEVRTKLIKTATQHQHDGMSMHPYWDMSRYVRNFEKGLLQVWDVYINKKEKRNIYIEDDGHETTLQDIKTFDKKKEKYITEQKLLSQPSAIGE